MTPESRHDPADAFRQAKDPDPGVRYVGARWLHRQAKAEVNRWSDGWLRDPGTVDALLPLLADPDPRVVEEAVGAAWGIAFRYRRDERLLAPGLTLLSSDAAKARTGAAYLVALFESPETAEPLLRLFGNPNASVRAAAIDAARQACGPWPGELRRRVREAALLRLGDRATEVRCQAADLLGDVGEAHDLPALKKCLQGIKGVNYRQSIREAVKTIQGRSATRRA